jgi:lysophospholipid acyltransferase
LAAVWRNLLAMVGVRYKYYFAWKISEGGAILAGFGFEGFKTAAAGGAVQCAGFGAVSNMDVLGFELAQSVRDASRCWNCGTQAWLERYVYLRLPPALAMVGTYFISAAWHGFYAG